MLKALKNHSFDEGIDFSLPIGLEIEECMIQGDLLVARNKNGLLYAYSMLSWHASKTIEVKSEVQILNRNSFEHVSSVSINFDDLLIISIDRQY